MQRSTHRKASAIWRGGLKDGQGSLSTESGALSNVGYFFATRFGEEKGANPEELIGAAHAGCFSMAFSGELEKRGLVAEKIETTASVTLEKQEKGFSVTHVHLTTRARVPDANARVFYEAAKTAKENCPISRVLKAEISVDAELETGERHPASVLTPGKSGKKQEFLRKISESVRLPRGVNSEKAVKTVLCTLSSHLTQGEAKDLAASLPEDLRSLLDACVTQRGERPMSFNRDQFNRVVGEYLHITADQAEELSREIFKMVRDYLPEKEISDIASQLPKDLKALWKAA